jgi:transcriptional regulator with XRE-family HTH domain
MTSETLGQRIRRLRLARGWTQEQLARNAGTSKGFLSELENGKHFPTSNMLLRIAEMLGVTTDHLMSGGPATEEDARYIQVPKELIEVAIQCKWSVSWMMDLLRVRDSLTAMRSNARSVYIPDDWKRLAEALKAYQGAGD